MEAVMTERNGAQRKRRNHPSFRRAADPHQALPGMSEIHLVWPNKHLKLLASGEGDYKWVQPNDSQRNGPLNFQSLTGHPLKPRSTVLAIGDGWDVLEALGTGTTLFREGIRLVYINPPFNTQVNFRQYCDTMKRSMWLSMIDRK